MPRKTKRVTFHGRPISEDPGSPAAPMIFADSVLFRAASADIIAIELGAEILRAGANAVEVEVALTGRLRLTGRGFQSLLAAVLEIQRQIVEAQQQATRSADRVLTKH